MIETPRLRLIRYTKQHADALERGVAELAAVLQTSVPEGWPEFPEAYESRRFEGNSGDEWGTYIFLLRDGSTLAGSGGYKSAPEGGVVEVGYEIAPPLRNNGLATEATRGLIDHAFSYEQVEAIEAHTLAERNASVRVLEKVGMSLIASLDDPDVGKVWRWHLARGDRIAAPVATTSE